jgi:hypothetical protein
MELDEARDALSFEVRFTPPIDLLGPPSAARRNPFGLRGPGTIGVQGADVVVRGRRPRPLWFAAQVNVAIPMGGISNVARAGPMVEFEYQLADGNAGRIAVWSRDEAAAEVIVGSLPRTTTEQFTREQSQLATFKSQLVAVSPTAWVTPALIVTNVLVFLWAVSRGAGLIEPDGLAMIRLGTDYGPLTTSGEWWRPPVLPQRSPLHEFQALLGEYVDARRSGYQKFVEAHAKHNPIMVREAQQLMQESDRKFAKLRALIVKL